MKITEICILIVLVALSCKSKINSEQMVEEFQWKIQVPKSTYLENENKSTSDINKGLELLEDHGASVEYDKQSKNYFRL